VDERAGRQRDTAVLWEIAKQLFRLYIEDVGVYSAMYDPG
jgi:hypothetical protein